MNEDQMPALGRLSRLQDHQPRSFDPIAQAGSIRWQMGRWRALVSRRWWIPLICLVLIGGPSVIYSWRAPKTFRSGATLWLGGRLELPEGRVYSEELSTYLGTQAELLKSSLIKQRALEKIRNRFPALARDEKSFEVTARNSVRSSTVEVIATGLDPEATRVFLDTLVSEYIDFKNESRKETSSSALAGITQQISQLEKQIQQQQGALTEFQTTNTISFLTETGVSAGAHLARINETLSELRTEKRLLELMTPEQLQGIGIAVPGSTSANLPGQRTAQSIASVSAAGQTSYYQALQQLQILKARRDDFAKVLRPNHSKMVRMNQEIDGLETLLATLKSQSAEEAFTQWSNRKKALELEIQNLQSQGEAWATNATEASAKLAQYERLKQDLERSNSLYNRLLNLVQTVDLTRSLDRETLTRLGPASEARATLGKYKIGAAGLFASLLTGLVILLVLSATDDRFTSAVELGMHIDSEVVGHIPENQRRLLIGNGALEHAFAESFRNLRSYITCMSDLPAGCRTVLITSAIPKEGKTTISTTLAQALASSGERVLVIDADVRRSGIHLIFKTQAGPGLREVLTSQANVKECIYATRIPNLWVLPAGQARDTAELFRLNHIESMLKTLRTDYDYILIDTAPLLAADDASALSRYVDGAFMVVRASHTPARAVREAMQRLNRSGVKLLGLIYNRAAVSTHSYYQYGREYAGE